MLTFLFIANPDRHISFVHQKKRSGDNYRKTKRKSWKRPRLVARYQDTGASIILYEYIRCCDRNFGSQLEASDQQP